MEPLELVARLLQAGPICDRCLGVRFLGLGTGLSAEERGQSLRLAARNQSIPSGEGAGGRCWVCDGVFTRVPEWAERAFQLVRDHEFSTFLFGVHLTPRLEAVEELLDERFPSPWAEPLRREFNRELGKAFERALVQEGRAATVDFRHPDVRFTVDLETGAVELGVSPVYFFGRYRKLVRGIPQTHWPCRECGGRGCERCGWTGKMYPVSVEELILPAFLTACQGETGHFHGAGREDTDARMLGRGRPFVLEIVGKKRTVDLAEVARRIEEGAQGQVEVCDLRPGNPKLVERLKVARMDKRYRARVSLPRPVKEETLRKALAGLVGEIEQRTPTRVRHRRADKVRRRCVHEAQGRLLSPTEAEVELLCEGGLYVKELITGDEGATHPSLSQLLGMPAQVIELDVLEVLDDL